MGGLKGGGGGGKEINKIIVFIGMKWLIVIVVILFNMVMI